jgi:hypothetical protein
MLAEVLPLSPVDLLVWVPKAWSFEVAGVETLNVRSDFKKKISFAVR